MKFSEAKRLVEAGAIVSLIETSTTEPGTQFFVRVSGADRSDLISAQRSDLPRVMPIQTAWKAALALSPKQNQFKISVTAGGGK